MAYSSPATVSDGNVAPASWGNSVKAATDFLANPPACRVYNSSNISITNGTLTTLTFNSERFDTDTMHSTSTNTGRITFNTAGLYVVGGNISWAADTDYTRRIFYIQYAGGTIARRSDESPSHALANAEEWNLETVWKFTAGEYAEMIVYQTNGSGGANNIVASAAYSPEFYACWQGLG